LTLAVGQRLGRFEILASLGAGGMGEVYRARDTKLGREVALKVLPEAVSVSAERRARFAREAKLLATLNHPLIASLYEVHENEGRDVLVMELVEGETLADRLRRGALPLKRALEVGRQVAEALEGAHDRSILHRDLKPANIMFTPAGSVKLLDFGLATALEAPAGSEVETVTSSPRVDDTSPGVALGTVPYMSPEQARGEKLDRRTDVWAFGCVLYEMLTGRRAFSGPTRSDVMAAVLEKEPDWEKLPAATPLKVQDLLHRCLQKDRSRRLRDIGDARLELQEAIEESEIGRSGPRVAAFAPRPVRLPLLAGLALLSLLGYLGWQIWPRQAGAPRLSTLTIPVGVQMPGSVIRQVLALSPDAGSVIYGARSDGKPRLFIQGLHEIAPRLLVEDATDPTYSPDGRWLAFLQGGELRKISVTGSTASRICPLSEARGLSWGPDNRIVFTPRSQSGLWSVSADGGEPEPLTTTDPERREISHRWPQVLPDGNHVLFIVHPASLSEDDGKLAILSLATRQWKVVVEGTIFGRYLPSGHVLYGRRGSLFAVPLDLGQPALTGSAVEMVSDVNMQSYGAGQALVATSSGGALAYVPGLPRPELRSLLWVDRTGRATPVTSRRLPFFSAALSPDGGAIIVAIDEGGPASRLEKLDVREGTWVRLAPTLRVAGPPLFSPNGRWIAFSADEEGVSSFYRMPADVSEAPERLLTPPNNHVLGGWSPDGKSLIFSMQDPESWWDLWTVSLEGNREPRLFLETPVIEMAPTFSPDGRYVAHLSDESGTRELVIRPFPGPGPSKQVSVGGAQEPLWSRDGKELFYRSRGKNPKLMGVKVATQPALVTETPRALFDDVYHRDNTLRPASFAMTPDGQRFLLIEQLQEPETPRQIVIIPNFAEEVKEKLRAASR
jgi:Tol biopolymer transport system component